MARAASGAEITFTGSFLRNSSLSTWMPIAFW